MKIKKALGFLTVTAAAAMLMCASAYAATYTVGATSAKPGETVTVPVKLVPDTGETASVNGYVVELTYDSSVLTPVQQGTDVLGEACYATSSIESGVLVSSLVDVEDTTQDKVVVAWADASASTTTEVLELATVEFTVNSASSASSTNVSVALDQAATDSSTLDTTSSTLAGTVTLGQSILRGDADGSGTVEIADALLIQQYKAGTATIADENLENADADGSGTIEIADALLIQQYKAGTATIG